MINLLRARNSAGRGHELMGAWLQVAATVLRRASADTMCGIGLVSEAKGRMAASAVTA